MLFARMKSATSELAGCFFVVFCIAPIGVSVSIIEPGFLPSALTAKAWQEEREKQQCKDEVHQAECQLYPHLYNTIALKVAEVLFANMGRIHETVEAMEHAMFASRPRPRYVTSVAGPLPAWIFLRVAELLPDHWFDMLYNFPSNEQYDQLMGMMPRWLIPTDHAR